MLIVHADSFSRSRIQTVIVAVITGNVELAEGPDSNGTAEICRRIGRKKRVPKSGKRGTRSAYATVLQRERLIHWLIGAQQIHLRTEPVFVRRLHAVVKRQDVRANLGCYASELLRSQQFQ